MPESSTNSDKLFFPSNNKIFYDEGCFRNFYIPSSYSSDYGQFHVKNTNYEPFIQLKSHDWFEDLDVSD